MQVTTPAPGGAHVNRSLAAATLAAVAVLGLAGCRVEPGAAAFIGNTRITDEQVDKINDEQVDIARGRGQEVSTQAIAANRQLLIERLTLAEVARRIVTEKGIAVTRVSATDVAYQNGRPQPSDIDRYVADTQPYLEALRAAVTPTALTDAEKKELTQNLVRLGADPSVAARFFGEPDLQRAMAFRKALRDGLDKYRVEVSPRYSEVAYPIWSVTSGGQQVDVMFLQLGNSDTAVEDRPKTEPLPTS